MPSENYMVLTKLLLGHASDDIPRANEIRTVIKDIWDIRMSKIRSSVNKLVNNMDSYADVKNLTVMEINTIRPLLPHALDQLYRMKTVNILCFFYVFLLCDLTKSCFQTRKPQGTQSQSTTFLSTTRQSTSFSVSNN